MGVWDSMKNTAAEIGNWALNNSGTIVKTVGTIAKIAGLVALTEEDYADGELLLPYLTTAIDGAQKKLLEASERHSPTPKSASDEWRVKTIDFPCFWPTPTAQGNAEPIPEIAMDINRVLAMHDVPNTIGNRDGDIGLAIAREFFNPDTTIVLDSDNGIKSNPLVINLGNIGKITGCMVHYSVPLGNPGYEGWHSHMRVHYLYIPEAESLYKTEKRARAIQPAPSELSPPYNAANIVVAWTGATGVGDFMAKAVRDLVRENQKSIEFSTVAFDGTSFTYQFKSITDIGPAEVASKLARAIDNRLRKLEENAATPTMPTIKVTNLQTILA